MSGNDGSDSISDLYAGGRARVCELVASIDEAELRATVPACPRWTVLDVVAHLAGTCADILDGNLTGVASDEWTDAQVSTRRGRPLGALLDEWNDLAPQVEAIAHQFPQDSARVWVMDLTTHEHDIRGATARPGARDSDGVMNSLDFLVGVAFAGSLRSRELPPLAVTTERRQWRLGPADEIAGEVQAPSFELFRALTGRRSPRQIKSLRWTADPDTYMPGFEFGPFVTSLADIVE